MKTTIYAGTYTSKSSKGIYSFDFEDGKMSNSKLYCEVKNPKYLCKDEDGLFTLGDFENGSGVGIVTTEGVISKVASEERTSCYIVKSGEDIYTSNYHTGIVTHLKYVDGALKYVNNVQIQNGAGCHQVLVYEDKILVPCLFMDRVFIFDKDLKKIGAIEFDAGVGPRHGVFTKDKQYLYLVSELSNELFVIHAGDWKIETVIPVLKSGETHIRDTAAIRLSEDEKHIYVSTRTKDVISVIDVEDHKPTVKETVSCGGKHPRDFILIDNYLLSANRNSDEVVCFKLNEDGTLGEITSKIEVPEVVSLVY